MAGAWSAVVLVSSAVIGAAAEETAAGAVPASRSYLETVLLALFAVVVGGLVIFKLTQKKLKLPPGPTPVPIFGNWLQVGDDLNHNNLVAMAKKYGDCFLLRMGQRNLTVISSPELAKEVLQTQGVEFGSRTRNVVFDIFTGNGQDMVFTVYGEHWRRMRRIMTVPFFTNKVVSSLRERWEKEVDICCEDIKTLEGASTTGIVIRKRMQLMMYNFMYLMMFDRRFPGDDDPLYNRLKVLNAERSRLSQSFEYNYGDFIPVLRPFLKKYLDHCKVIKEKRLGLFKEYFLDERKRLLNTKGVASEKLGMDHIFDAQRNGEINEDNVLYIVENINVAAIETTLWSMEWGLAELVNHQEIQSKLRNELDSVLGKGVPVTEPDIQSGRLPYLTAVVKETLRLHMAIPLLVPHMNLHQAKLAGYDIPAESKILVNAWWLANDPALWKRPEEFRPERFLEEEKGVEASGNDFRYLPFGAGRRSCPGIILALPLLGLVLGRFVQRFEFTTPPGVDRIDTEGLGGQFSLRIKNHSTIVCKPRA